MSDYLYIFRGGEFRAGEPQQSPEAMQAHMQKWMAWIKELTVKGIFKGGEPLAKEGKVLQGRGKRVTDGPYAEAKDIVGGYLLVEAKDIDHAVELSRACPIFDVDGSLEVRPVMKM
jgi:hypothetical protein